MRSTAGAPTRTTAAGAGTGGVSRPSSLGDVAGRDTKPARRTSSAVGTGGWDGYRKEAAERSQRYPQLEIDKRPVVVRFAEADPLAYIFRHWVDRKPYTCIGKEVCPLCLANHRPKPVVFYNVIDVNDATLKVWELSKEPTDRLFVHYDKLKGQDKTLADPGLYFIVSKRKKDNGYFEYTIERTRVGDSSFEEAGIEPLTDAEIAAAIDNHGKGLYTDEIVWVSSVDDLTEAAENLSDTD
jgi:hypothetical protein